MSQGRRHKYDQKNKQKPKSYKEDVRVFSTVSCTGSRGCPSVPVPLNVGPEVSYPFQELLPRYFFNDLVCCILFYCTTVITFYYSFHFVLYFS